MMKFLIGVLLIFISAWFTAYQDQYNRYERYMLKAKFDAEEVAAAAAQYFMPIEYSEGKYVFNQQEGIKAAEYILKKRLELDNAFKPSLNTYWTDTITYKIEFFDDSNTIYPYLYTHESSYFTEVITNPTVVVTINLGKPRFSTISNPTEVFRTAAHTFRER